MTALLAAAGLFRRDWPIVSAASRSAVKDVGWTIYGGDAAGRRFSPLRQINRQNVQQLKRAWTFDTHEPGGLQTNPLIVGRTLYGLTPSQKVVALDAVTGKQIWSFSAEEKGAQPVRGLTWWTDGRSNVLFVGLLQYLYALDPATGNAMSTFGKGGRIDLRKDLAEGDYKQSFAAMTSPAVVYKDLLVVGFRAPETLPALRGDIRAYDVHTGRLRWQFHTIPHPGEPGYATWPKDAWKTSGAANNWAGMVLDRKRGIVYAPTGSAADDFYGADRTGDDLYANTLLALDAATGKLLWHFQGVHHDIWDRDFPSPPVLVSVRSSGRLVDAVAQPTKQGFLFVLDRVTGEPLFPVEEHAFPASDVDGEHASLTQPVPLIPAPFARQSLTEQMLTTRTPEAHAWAVNEFKKLRSGGLFVPLATGKQTVVLPGFDGGAEWGGSAWDPRTGVLYLNANDLAWTGGLVQNKPGGSLGASTYQSQCSACHGPDRKGAPPAFPTLLAVSERLTEKEIARVVHGGKGRMPAYPNIADDRLKALLQYLKDGLGDAGTLPVQAHFPDGSNLPGLRVYEKNCALCHGEDLAGAPSNYPGLIGVRDRLSDQQILANIHQGKGRMPSLSKISDADIAALLGFLGKTVFPQAQAVGTPREGSKQEVQSVAEPSGEPRYRFTGYRKFLDLDGYPAIAPPWGTLNAIDLNTGKFLWKIPLGEYPELAAKGMNYTGSENYGGPVATAGGVVFIGATIYDRKLRAFDSGTGELLWQTDLPYAGNATPSIYRVDGREYLVIATSGLRDPKGPQGAAYVAFALPRGGNHR